MSAPKKPVVYVCRGGDCRDHKKARRKLVETLNGHVRLREVKCQKICKGPVLGLEHRETVEWFAAVDSRKARDAVLYLLDEGEIKRPLRKRRVKGKAGKLR